MDSRLSQTKRRMMEEKKTRYLFFASGILVGGIFVRTYMSREKLGLVEKLTKMSTITNLVFDTDKWIWKTIDDPGDIDKWTDELKDRLEYIEMIVALYSLEE